MVSYFVRLNICSFTLTLVLISFVVVYSGPTICAAAYTPGTREGSTVLYRCDKYPQGALGEVRFLWKARNVDDKTGYRQLWLWAHPACYTDVLSELTLALEVTLMTEVMDPTSKNTVEDAAFKAKAGMKRKAAQMVETVLCKKRKASASPSITSRPLKISNPVYTNDTVTVTSLKDTLCRFRLTGPGSVGVLLDALHSEKTGDPELDLSDLETTRMMWWEKLYSATAWRQAHMEQQKLWRMMKKIGSPAELTPHCVLALTVRDPGSSFPLRGQNSAVVLKVGLRIRLGCQHLVIAL